MRNILIATALICSGFFGLYGQIINTSLYSTKDSYTISNITSNFGLTTDLNAGITLNKVGAASFRRTYVGFNISSIPADAIITSAVLKVYQTTGLTATPSTVLYAERVTQNWLETTIATGTEPSVSTSEIVTSSTYASNWRSFNVLTHVQKMVNGTYTNEGWRIRYFNETQTTADNYVFHSRENTNDPVLVLSYYVPLKISSVAHVHCSTTSTSNGSITPTFSNGCGAVYTYDWINSAGITVGTGSSLNGVGYGWYGLHAYNTANNDHLYMAFLLGVTCQNVAIEFNPLPSYIDDAVINDANPTLNSGSNVNFVTARIQVITPYYNYKSLLRFRLWMDNSIVLNQADLLLKGNSHITTLRANSAEFDKITSAWNENVVTWNNTPSSTTAIQELISTTSGANDPKTVNLISFWNDWKSNNPGNQGVLFQLQSFSNPAATMNFHSSEAAISSNRPTINFIVNLTGVNGCQPLTINDVSFSLLKSKLDGGHASTFDEKLKISFKEESGVASSKYISYEIRDKNNLIIAGSDINGTTFGGAVAILYSNDDNNHIMNLAGITALINNSFYTLEVISTNGTRKKLRFIYYN